MLACQQANVAVDSHCYLLICFWCVLQLYKMKSNIISNLLYSLAGCIQMCFMRLTSNLQWFTKSLFLICAHPYPHTYVIHLFMRSGLWSEASQAALWIISILHGKLMSGGHAHRPQGTQSIPSHWASVGDCVVSPFLNVWSCSFNALPYGHCVRTLQDFFGESPCGPDSLCPDVAHSCWAKMERQRAPQMGEGDSGNRKSGL